MRLREETRRDGPGRHEIVRLFPAEQAGTLPFVLLRGVLVTILIRLVTLCIHSRPQSGHVSGINRSAPILTLTRPYGISRGLKLPIESERVQRAISGACQATAATGAQPGRRRASQLVNGAWDRRGPGPAGRRGEAGGPRLPDPGSGRTQWAGRSSASGRGARLRGSRLPRGR